MTALPANGLGAVDAFPPRPAVALIRPVASPVEAPGEWHAVLRHFFLRFNRATYIHVHIIISKFSLYLARVAVVSCPAVTDIRLSADSAPLFASLRALRVSAVIVRILG